MAQAGFTPIITYHSTTPAAVPTAANLAPGELGLNIADMKLYCENSSGVVTLLADAAAQGSVTSVATGTGLTGGPITTTGTVSVATNGITDALLRQSAGLSLIGRSANSTGNVADITAAADHNVLRRSGTTIGFGAISLNQSGAVTGTLAAGNGGTGNAFFTVSGPATSIKTYTFPNENMSVGYLNIPAVADKTTSYSLTTGDIGKVVGVGSGGSITIPNSTFAAGDAVLIFNNTAGDITITCTITTAYIAGTDADVASVTLATRGVCNILFLSGTACVLTGNIA